MKAVEIPHLIKYMGSKRNIMEPVVDAIERVIDETGAARLYDVFGGSGVVSAAFRETIAVTCNDIQAYTSILANTYLQNYNWEIFPENVLDEICDTAAERVENFKRHYPQYRFSYNENISFEELKKMDEEQRELLNKQFNGLDHLFVKSFSGTYWSYEQNLWIDAISSVARSEPYRDTFLYNVIKSSLMFAMAYCTQSTGHYAQFRKLTEENAEDILFYRTKEILPLFRQKFEALKEYYNGENNSDFAHRTTNSDFEEVMQNLEQGSVVYADPPYQFVHYSRFYHALETLAKYDYPELKFTGRYRTDRHQSPFCIRTQVKGAFRNLFARTSESQSSLVLSYSNTGMIDLDTLEALAEETLEDYNFQIRRIDYIHSTMGRQRDKSRNVEEAILTWVPN